MSTARPFEFYRPCFPRLPARGGSAAWAALLAAPTLLAGCSHNASVPSAVMAPPVKLVTPAAVAAVPAQPAVAQAPQGSPELDQYAQWLKQFEEARKAHSQQAAAALTASSSQLTASENSHQAAPSSDDTLQKSADDDLKICQMFNQHPTPKGTENASTAYYAFLNTAHVATQGFADLQKQAMTAVANNDVSTADRAIKQLEAGAPDMVAKEKATYQEAATAISALQSAHPEIPASHWPTMTEP